MNIDLRRVHPSFPIREFWGLLQDVEWNASVKQFLLRAALFAIGKELIQRERGTQERFEWLMRHQKLFLGWQKELPDHEVFIMTMKQVGLPSLWRELGLGMLELSKHLEEPECLPKT